MSDLSPEQEYSLRDRELQQEKELREREVAVKEHELSLKRRDSKYGWLTGPLLVGFVASAVGYYGHSALNEQAAEKLSLATEEFCYRVLADSLTRLRQPEHGRAVAEVGVIARAVARICGDNVREAADQLYVEAIPLAAAASSPPPAEPASSPPAAAAASSPPAAGACEKFQSIKALGWVAGHKTKFCQVRGFEGVFNPYGDYSAGGFCFTGDSQACINQIRHQAK